MALESYDIMNKMNYRNTMWHGFIFNSVPFCPCVAYTTNLQKQYILKEEVKNPTTLRQNSYVA